MLETGSIALEHALALVLGVVFVVLGLAGAVLARRRSSGSSTDRQRSVRRHRAAQRREPPVDLGDVREVAISEFSEHHSGKRRGVGRIEGFVVFVEDLPADVEVTDVVRIKILSFNRGHTSATATYVGRG